MRTRERVLAVSHISLLSHAYMHRLYKHDWSSAPWGDCGGDCGGDCEKERVGCVWRDGCVGMAPFKYAAFNGTT